MSCNTTIKNFGTSEQACFFGLVSQIIVTPDDFTISAADVAAGGNTLRDAIQDALLDDYADRSYFFPNLFTFEDISTEATYQDTPLKYKGVDKGKYIFRMGISEDMCAHRALATHKRNNGRVILIDRDGHALLSKLSSGDYQGAKIAELFPEKMKFNTGSEIGYSPFVLALGSVIEIDKKGYLVDFSGFVDELYRIVDVDLTIVGTPTTSSIVVDVKSNCDQTGISGLATADFLLVDNDDGATHAISSATESTTVAGRYTLAGTAFEDSTLTLDPPSVLSIKAYESTGAVAVNIP